MTLITKYNVNLPLTLKPDSRDKRILSTRKDATI